MGEFTTFNAEGEYDPDGSLMRISDHFDYQDALRLQLSAEANDAVAKVTAEKDAEIVMYRERADSATERNNQLLARCHAAESDHRPSTTKEIQAVLDWHAKIKRAQDESPAHFQDVLLKWSWESEATIRNLTDKAAEWEVEVAHARRQSSQMVEVNAGLCDTVEALQARVKELDEFVPTSERINALPEGLRRYIHDIETKCDPSGDVQTIACLRDQVRGLEARVKELESEVAGIGRDAPEALRRLGGMLADLLDEDKWALVEPMLITVQARVKELEGNIARIADDYHPSTFGEASLALCEMRQALRAVLAADNGKED